MKPGQMGKLSAKLDGVILGHEFSGIVTEIGVDVTHVKVGDKVVVDPNNCCGVCFWSNEKKPHFCEANKAIGVHTDGGWTEYCVAPAKGVYKLPDNISLLQGALAEPYSCVLRGWKQLGDLPQKDARILVQGAGIIGALFCTLVYNHGFTNVTVSEINEERRKLCAETNPGFNIIHPKELDQKLSEKNVDSEGFHMIVDCTGNPSAVEKMFDYARRGATVSIFGCCPAGRKISIEPFQIYWKELKIVGSFTNPLCFVDTMNLLAELQNKHLLDFNKLGIKVFSLSDYKNAFKDLKSGNASKV
uniref:Enoyl reductase (ER) domain-containing protein n=1 Tax=Ciona savignyi TaxID=51511 RepID=H2ZFL5_CIOSA